MKTLKALLLLFLVPATMTVAPVPCFPFNRNSTGITAACSQQETSSQSSPGQTSNKEQTPGKASGAAVSKDGSPGSATGDDPKAAEAGREIQREIQRGQAIDLLKSVLDEATSLDDISGRARVVAGAAETLWPHAPETALHSYSAIIDKILNDYEGLLTSGANATSGKNASSQKKAELAGALMTVLRSLARVDAKASSAAMARYIKIRRDAAKDGATTGSALNDSLSLASESLGVGLDQSISLAQQVLQHGVPSNFAQYLYDLAGNSKDAADALLRSALPTVASGAVYSPGQLAVLSSYPFRETVLLEPTPYPNPPGTQFGQFTNGLNPPPDLPSDPGLEGDFLSATLQYLNATAFAQGSPSAANPGFVGQAYFLAVKLAIYAARDGLDQNGQWELAVQGLQTLGRNDGIKDADLEGLAGYAQRAAQNNNIFQFDGGESEFEAASAADDPQQRQEHLIEGTVEAIEEQKYPQAESKLKGVSDSSARQTLKDFLALREGQTAAEHHDWLEVSARASEIADAQSRIFLLLAAGREAVLAGAEERASEYTSQASGSIPKVPGKKDAAADLVCAASIMSVSDPAFSAQSFSEGVKDMNRAEDYQGGDLQFTLPAMGHRRPMPMAPLRDCSLEASVSARAKQDWISSVESVRQISNRVLRLRAEIAAGRSVLARSPASH